MSDNVNTFFSVLSDNNSQKSNTLGHQLKIWRATNSFTMAQLSKKLGISQGYLSDIENDKKSPSARLLRDIYSLTGINVGMFYFNFDDPQEAKVEHLKYNPEDDTVDIMSDRIHSVPKLKDDLEGLNHNTQDDLNALQQELQRVKAAVRVIEMAIRRMQENS